MNGYNWEAFFNYYLPKYAPDVMEGMDTDPEAGMYAAYYSLTPENEAKAGRFAEIIRSLVEMKMSSAASSVRKANISCGIEMLHF